MNSAVVASILSGAVVAAIAGWFALLSQRTASRSTERSAKRSDENKATEIVSEAYVIANEMKEQALAGVRSDMALLKADIATMRVELNETKTALHESERNTARAERNVQTLRDLLISRGIPVPDLEGGNG